MASNVCFHPVFALPFPLLSSLTSLSGREKTGLVGIFTLGAVTLGVSSGRFATMMIKGNDISICKSHIRVLIYMHPPMPTVPL